MTLASRWACLSVYAEQRVCNLPRRLGTIVAASHLGFLRTATPPPLSLAYDLLPFGCLPGARRRAQAIMYTHVSGRA